jgi:hypothetical protein
MFKASDWLMIPFSLMWGGFAIFWESSVISKNAPPFFILWGIPFVLMALYITIGRFFYDAKLRSNTLYGLTEKRAIIISGVFSKKIQSVNLKSSPEIQVSKNADGSGTIVFGRSGGLDGFQYFGGRGQAQSAPTFEAIKDVSTVAKYIQQYQSL